MAYDIVLADRIRELIFLRAAAVEEKRMFGGLCFMVHGKMCVTTRDDRIMVRLSQEDYAIEVEGEGCRPMIHGGREMKGFVFVAAEQIRTKAQLKRWVDMALAYNEAAPRGKKR
jgi:TfoX/Sxy family transcriptional regulator of competence genes